MVTILTPSVGNTAQNMQSGRQHYPETKTIDKYIILSHILTWKYVKTHNKTGFSAHQTYTHAKSAL